VTAATQNSADVDARDRQSFPASAPARVDMTAPRRGARAYGRRERRRNGKRTLITGPGRGCNQPDAGHHPHQTARSHITGRSTRGPAAGVCVIYRSSTGCQSLTAAEKFPARSGPAPARPPRRVNGGRQAGNCRARRRATVDHDAPCRELIRGAAAGSRDRTRAGGVGGGGGGGDGAGTLASSSWTSTGATLSRGVESLIGIIANCKAPRHRRRLISTASTRVFAVRTRPGAAATARPVGWPPHRPG